MDKRKIKAGDRYKWGSHIHIEITRVATDESWADIRAIGPSGNSWRKRMPLPLSDEYKKVSDGDN